MSRLSKQLAATTLVALGSMLSSNLSIAATDSSPNDWLKRMAGAVQTTNYEGTVIRMRNGNVEALKVVHVVADGVIREKVIVQEGNGLEIIRNGNEVHCILPDKRRVLVEEWNDQSTLFSTLPSSEIRFGSEYDVSIVRTERVAGRQAVLLAIRPHDEFRFGHRLWLDTSTAFPLQTKLIGDDGNAFEQVKFVDISLGEDIDSNALAPSIDIENFRWFTSPKRTISHSVDADWRSDNLPAGFRVVSVHQEELSGSDEPVTHILYSDGLANVSVFIEPAKDSEPARRTRVGASNSYSHRIGGHQVTAIGEVPAATVEQIATSMQPR